MAESKSPPLRPSRREINRTAIGLNVTVLLILTFVIIAFANTMSYRHYERWDFSHAHNYALSNKTKVILAHLEEPVHAYVFFTPTVQSLMMKDVTGLLREYDYASNKKFTVEYVDQYRNLTKARELFDTYKFKDTENLVILDYKGRNKFVYAQELANFDPPAAQGQLPTMREFKGEEAITSALQGLLEEKQKKLYIISGHGEPVIDAEATGFRDLVKRENVEYAMLNLGDVENIPADANGVLIFGPRADFSEREMWLINEYWSERKGRLLVLLNPDGPTSRLEEWLIDQGIKPQGDRILRTGTVRAGGTTQSGVFISPDVIYAKAGGAVTKELADIQSTFLGFTESLQVSETLVQAKKLKVLPLVISGPNYWGETEYVSGSNQPVYFDPQKDHMGPLVVGVALEKGGMEDTRVKVDTARLIVIGNAGFVTDRGLQLSATGGPFAVLMLNWLFNRELISGIPPKTKEALVLTLNEKTMSTIFWSTVVAVPLATALLGLYVTWFRRNRSLLTLTVWVMGIGLFVVGAGWALNLYFESRESSLNPVDARSYVIPALMALVPLVIFTMHILRKPLELPLHRDSV